MRAPHPPFSRVPRAITSTPTAASKWCWAWVCAPTGLRTGRSSAWSGTWPTSSALLSAAPKDPSRH